MADRQYTYFLEYNGAEESCNRMSFEKIKGWDLGNFVYCEDHDTIHQITRIDEIRNKLQQPPIEK